jgi:hypothetical protein
MTAFKDTDYARARPRGPGMERADLLAANAQIFTAQGKALNAVASRNVKVLVVGNPANTNAYIAMKSAPDLPAKNFTAMLRLDHNRALASWPPRPARPWPTSKAVRVGQPLAHHVRRLPLRHHRRQNVKDMINDQDWNANVFLPTVGKRGAAIIEARGLSSAASAANAAIDHMRDWALGTNGEWVTMGIPSDGSYGIPKDTCSASRHLRERRIQGRRGPADRRLQPVHRQDAGRARGREGRREAPALNRTQRPTPTPPCPHIPVMSSAPRRRASWRWCATTTAASSRACARACNCRRR